MRGIIFSPELVPVLLSKGCLQTRRVIKPQPHQRDSGYWWFGTKLFASNTRLLAELMEFVCPYGQVGDKMYVKETWRIIPGANGTYCLEYVADPTVSRLSVHPDTASKASMTGRWRSSLFMPQWASRAIVQVVRVRVQQLGDMTQEDAMASGCASIVDYRILWTHIHGDRCPYDPSLWVWALDLEVVG